MTGKPVTPPSGELSESSHPPAQPRKNSPAKASISSATSPHPYSFAKVGAPIKPLFSCRWERVGEDPEFELRPAASSWRDQRSVGLCLVIWGQLPGRALGVAGCFGVG